MKYSMSILLLTLFLAAGAAVFGQDSTKNRLTVQAGISIFPNPVSGPEVYVEIPFSVNRSQFLFVQVDSSDRWLRAAIFAEVVFSDTLGQSLDSASTLFYTRVRDSAEARKSDVKLFNKFSLMLSPGMYKGKLNVIDVASKKEGSFLYDKVEIPAIVSDSLALSSLELAYEIKVVDDSSASNQRLVKNGREVIPSPMGIFSRNDSLIYVYAELYNLQFDSTKHDQFRLNYRVFRSDGSLHFDYGEILEEKPGPSSVVTTALQTAGWDPGRYNLTLTATDLQSGKSATASKRFIIFPKSGTLPDVVTYTQKSPLDTAGIQTKSNMVRYLMTPQEWAIFSSLTDSGKTRYVSQFFKDKNPTPGSDKNAYLDDAFRRYQYANEHFSTVPGVLDGWRTDRGRVLMQYGQWDERSEMTAPAYSHPWERWYYRNIQGGGILFIFEDVNGYGDYKLVHSTAKGEIFSSDWDKIVKEQNLEIY